MMDYDMYSKDWRNPSATVHDLSMDSKRLTINQMHRKFCLCPMGKVSEKFRLEFLVLLPLENSYNKDIDIQ